MTPRLQRLFDSIKNLSPVERLGELTVEVKAADYLSAAERLRRDGFEQLSDLCGLNQKQGQTTISWYPGIHEKRGLSLISGVGC